MNKISGGFDDIVAGREEILRIQFMESRLVGDQASGILLRKPEKIIVEHYQEIPDIESFCLVDSRDIGKAAEYIMLAASNQDRERLAVRSGTVH